MVFRPLVFGMISVLSLAGCHDSATQTASVDLNQRGPVPVEEGAWFIDVASYLGIDFVHSFGDTDFSNVAESVGSGVAFLDYDQDGWVDLYFVSSTFKKGISEGEKPEGRFRNRLFRNLEGKAFQDVTDRAGLADENGFGMGVAVSDYNNDGYPDIYVCNYGPNVLFRNNGDGTFSDVTRQAGVAGGDDANTVGAVWLDFDRDGWLDLYAGNYLMYDPDYNYYYTADNMVPPMAYPGQPDVLYRNLGNGKFEDVTEKMGVYQPEGRMMGVGAADYDNDGWIDIYLANDAMANYLYHNEQSQGFRDVSYISGTAFSTGGEETSSMSVDFADYDGDGLYDFFVADIHYSALYKNNGSGLFTDVTVPSGVAVPSGQYDGWGSGFIDYDNDGDVDIFKANGAANHFYGHEDQVLSNMGDGTFRDVSLDLGSYFFQEFMGRGVAFGDYDNDGDLDVAINNMGDRAVLLRNENLDQHNWLEILLVGTQSNRDGIGARVSVTAGGKNQVAPKESASGYLSTNDPRMHFGLARNEKVERIEVQWPSGAVQVLEDVPANQLLIITETQLLTSTEF